MSQQSTKQQLLQSQANQGAKQNQFLGKSQAVQFKGYNNKQLSEKRNNNDLDQENSFDHIDRGGAESKSTNKKAKSKGVDPSGGFDMEFRNQTFGLEPSKSLDKRKQTFQYPPPQENMPKADSNSNTQIIHQASLSNSLNNSSIQPNLGLSQQESHPENRLDSNGNIIRGRKIDSPHLLVVRELRELEDQEDPADFTEQQQQFLMMMMQGYGSGSGGTEEIPQAMWSSKEGRGAHSEGRIIRKQKMAQQRAKSQDNKKKLSKGYHQNQKAKMFKETDNVQYDNQTKISDYQIKKKEFNQRGIKSQREVRTSMGFNELLNQLDKDVSLHQQKKQLADFKNRTVHDVNTLGGELSGIRRQNSLSGPSTKQKTAIKTNKGPQEVVQPRSKSRERKHDQGMILQPKKNNKSGKNGDLSQKEHIFNYAIQNSNIQTEVTPDKGVSNGQSFIQSEHGRCITSQGLSSSNHQQNLSQNGRTKSQSTIIPQPFNNILVLKNSGQGQTGYLNPIIQSAQNQRTSKDSPERLGIKEFKTIGNIDKLIRDNLKKIRSKEEEQFKQRLESEDHLKKKRQMNEQNNAIVRMVNKEKTYKKQNPSSGTALHQQQSQDPQMIEFFGKEKKIKILKNDIFMVKPSQTQKIDFEKIRESGKGKRLNIKNHRKSYGLEFIDIKREIQDELKTLDEKFKMNQNQSLLFNQKIQTANNTEQSIKKMKSRYGGNKSDYKSDKDDILSNVQPIKQVIVIKKTKIRKFMKAKKKELIQQQSHQRKEEIIRTVKMQENISKLNDFCKKKLEKQHVKKRNATLQSNPLIALKSEGFGDASKISVKKLLFENVKKSQHTQQAIDLSDNEPRQFEDGLTGTFNQQDDSSRLSTEFYEEYFRLLNSIKKEQGKGNVSDQNLRGTNGQISEVDANSNNITQINKNSTIFKSPSGRSGSKTSPSPISHNIKSNHIISPKQITMHSNQIPKIPKAVKKSSSKTQEGLIKTKPPNGLRNKASQGDEMGTQPSNKNLRAESAPLLTNQQSSLKKRAYKSPKKKTKVVKGRDVISQSEDEKMIYILNQVIRIQRNYKNHLLQKGFYDQVYYQQQQQYFLSESDQNLGLINQDGDEIENDSSDQPSISGLKDEILALRGKQLPMNENMGFQGVFGADDSEEEEEEEEDEEGDMIIINQHQNMDDEKKVVYMSNINSCSLPQTPKQDDKSQHDESTMKKVFEYKPAGNQSHNQDQFFYQSEIGDQVHQSISNKPSLYTIESEADDKKKQDAYQKRNLPYLNQQEEEIKIADYGMRIFTGSESLLREFKLNTPKHTSQQNQGHKESISQVSARLGISTQNSQKSLHLQPLQQNSIIDSKKSQEHTSQSSQSLFERNSFQQFTMQKLSQIMKNNEYLNLISMREKALEYRVDKEHKFIKKMYKKKQYSPRTYSSKKEQLEKWVRVEKEEITKTKKAFQEEWQKTVQIIEDTQKNVDKMRERMKISIDNNKHPHQMYNSQSSRNSSSSYVTSAKQEQRRRSLLEDEQQMVLTNRSQIAEKQPDTIIHLRKDVSQESQQWKSLQESMPVHQDDNLIEFLETSWQKNVPKDHRQASLSRQGIYIEDQNDKIHSSQLSDNIDLSGTGDKLEKLKEQLTQKQKYDNVKSRGDERPLMRSRSEQDLSEMIKKSKLSEKENIEESNDTFRVLDSDKNVPTNPLVKQLNRDESNPSQEILFFNIDSKVPIGEIKIQENMFEDSSNRYSKGREYYQEGEHHEIQSNDSLLNESDLNNYFQDQKFSIEDFKSLDKKRILVDTHSHHGEEDESDDLHKSVEDKDPQALGEEVDEKKEEIQSKPLDVEDILLIDRSKNSLGRFSNSEIQTTAFMQHQQAMLFQNAKPGENIKISDILKKTQIMSAADTLNSFLGDQSNQQLLFSNQQISHSMVAPSTQPLLQADNSILAEKITDQILQSLLSQSLDVPQRQPFNNFLQPGQYQNQPIDGNQDIFMIDSPYSEKEMRREQIEMKQRGFIEIDLQRIENYINEIIASLQQSEIQSLAAIINKNNPQQQQTVELDAPLADFHRIFLQVLTTPIKRNELDLLNQLQTSEIGSYEHFETTYDPTNFPILPVDLYLEIERQREEMQLKMIYSGAMGIGPGQDIDIESSIIQESLHIHNKAIFDALNESLMKFRPYGIQGEPMPWSNKNRRLQTKVDTNSVDTERLFMMVKQDVLRWVQTFAGCQPSHVFLFKKNQMNQQMPFFAPPQSQSQLLALQDGAGDDQFDDELFQETRERRLAQMLASEVIETEHHWLNYEFEEAQVKIDLSDMILEHLVEELVVFINQKNGIHIADSPAPPQILNTE